MIFETIETPKIVGYWVLPGSIPGHETMFGMAGKPDEFHIKMMSVVLGWEWKDV
jgi:hypothetical protein